MDGVYICSGESMVIPEKAAGVQEDRISKATLKKLQLNHKQAYSWSPWVFFPVADRHLEANKKKIQNILKKDSVHVNLIKSCHRAGKSSHIISSFFWKVEP